MQRSKLFGVAVLLMVIALMLITAGCFSSTGITGGTSGSTTAVKPDPVISQCIATTSGTQAAYYATLDIKVKNNGAEGIVLVTGSITQNNTTNSNQMPVYLMHGEEHELKMTFPLAWGAGNFEPKASASIP